MTRVAISQDSSIRYPRPEDYSPGQRYPEYPFKNIALGENRIFELIRNCLYDAGADQEHYGAELWNPLGQWIRKRDRVFILPNLVAHRRPEETDKNFLGKCTNASVMRALIDYVIIATGEPSYIHFGNAPLQSCDYEQVSQQTGMAQLAEFYAKITGSKMGPYDLRGLISRWSRFGALLEIRERKEEDIVFVDLGADSFLDELFRKVELPVQVRVGDYDPRETMAYHDRGRHIYAINRRVLESDVIISLPKLKTHQKVGITTALKGAVGTIARKECLAHHRKGGPANNGDEFPQDSWLRSLVSDFSDRAARTKNSGGNTLRRISKVMSYLLRLGKHGFASGGWYGNDTAWRMALDINRILLFARSDGTLSDTPQRQHLALVDGIVAGEGEGPLIPLAKEMGLILFGTDICAVDYACALIMGFDPLKIPLIRNSFAEVRYPLTEHKIDEVKLIFNGTEVTSKSLPKIVNAHFLPPKGWRGFIELGD